MEYRWLGAAMIVIGCGSCGFSIAAGKRKEEQMLCQLIRILRFMEAELRYRLTPLPDLCRLASCEVKGTLRVVFLNLYREIRKFFTFQARIRGYTMNNHSVQILGVRA